MVENDEERVIQLNYLAEKFTRLVPMEVASPLKLNNTKYAVELTIGHQSFRLDLEYELEEAMWVRQMLGVALSNMLLMLETKPEGGE